MEFTQSAHISGGAVAEPGIELGRFLELLAALPRDGNVVALDLGYVRDMFAEAVDQDFLFKDPAARVKILPQLRAKDTTTLTWDHLRMALEVLDECDRILLELDMTDALRPSELSALRWKCFDPEHTRLVILETVYKRKIRPWGKHVRASRRFIFRPC